MAVVGGWPTFTFFVKAWVPTFTKYVKVGQPPNFFETYYQKTGNPPTGPDGTSGEED